MATQPTQPSNSTIDQLLGMIEQNKQKNPMADLGSVLGSASQGEKANRVVEGNFQGDFDRMMLDREARQNQLGLTAQADRNANESDAMKKMQQTSYIMGGGSNFGPQNISLNGQQRQLPVFPGIAPMKPTDADKAGASSLQGQLGARLQPGGSFQPQWNYQPKPVDEYAKPGLLEKLLGYGGAVSSGLGSIFGNPQNASNVGDWIKKLFGKGTLPSKPATGLPTYTPPTFPMQNQNVSQGMYPFNTENPGLYNGNNALQPVTGGSWAPAEPWDGLMYGPDFVPGSANAPSIEDLLGPPPPAGPNYDNPNNWG